MAETQANIEALPMLTDEESQQLYNAIQSLNKSSKELMLIDAKALAAFSAQGRDLDELIRGSLTSSEQA